MNLPSGWASRDEDTDCGGATREKRWGIVRVEVPKSCRWSEPQAQVKPDAVCETAGVGPEVRHSARASGRAPRSRFLYMVVMSLSYDEARLFLRAGDDMRRPVWPNGDFVRWVIGEPQEVEGYEITPYNPTPDDFVNSDWRRA